MQDKRKQELEIIGNFIGLILTIIAMIIFLSMVAHSCPNGVMCK